MGAVNIDNTGTGSAVTLSSNGTQLLLNGSAVGGGASALTIDNKTGAYTVVAGDLGKIINCTSGTFTVSLTAAATLGAGFNCWIWNTSTTAANEITIDPNGTETIDGKSTRSLRRGEGLQIICDGTNWQTGDKKVMRGYAENIAASEERPIASGSNAIGIGLSANASGAVAVAIGGTSGSPTQASSAYAVAIGSTSAGNGAQAVTGSAAMALGGSYASGTDSFAAAVGNNTSTYGAIGSNSFAAGYLAKASNASSIALNSGVASGAGAFAIGGYNFAVAASGTSSYAVGEGVTASGAFSYAFGTYALSSIYGKYAYGSGRFAATGDAQTGAFVLRRSTTDATATVLTSDGAAPATTNQIILPNDSTYTFRILVVARRTDADNESAGYEFVGVVDRNANAASTALVGTVTKTVIAEDTAAWDVTVTADTTNGGLKVEVTGEAAKTIRWVATCWTSEVTG